jgi:hypothetical protein
VATKRNNAIKSADITEAVLQKRFIGLLQNWVLLIVWKLESLWDGLMSGRRRRRPARCGCQIGVR